MDDNHDFDIPTELGKLPNLPGVYVMRGANDEILYVGKAKNLRKRVHSYFRDSVVKTAKIQKMVSLISRFEYIVTHGEVEALILENNLIKENSPKYNTLLKDDKTYPYVRIDLKQQFPVLMFVRRVKRDGAKYLGPYTNGSLREVLSMLNKIYKLRTCNRVFPRDINKGRPCLNYHIGNCCAPCLGSADETTYMENISCVIHFFSGNKKPVLKELTKQMERAAQDLDFEEAAYLRDQISKISELSQSQTVSSVNRDDCDMIAMASGQSDAVVQVFFLRDGKLVGREHYYMTGVAGEEDYEAATKINGTTSVFDRALGCDEAKNTVIPDRVSGCDESKSTVIPDRVSGCNETKNTALSYPASGCYESEITVIPDRASGWDETKNTAVSYPALGCDESKSTVIPDRASGCDESKITVIPDPASGCDGSKISDDDPLVIENFIKQFYSGTAVVPAKIYIPCEIPDKGTIQTWLSAKREKSVSLIVPQKGANHDLMQLAKNNAQLIVSKNLERLKSEDERTRGALAQLARHLGFENLRRIESYDISNTSGYYSVASMVVYEDGKPKRSDYRKFRIKTVSGADDYASIAEVISRRFRRLNETPDIRASHGQDSGISSFNQLPDIIFIDGGAGQVNAAKTALYALAIDLPVAGMVKDEKHRTEGLVYKEEKILLDKNEPSYKLLTRIQDEVHRFAIAYHKSLRGKEQVKSVLDDIPRIGKTRRNALMRHFESIEAIKQADVETLASVDGMDKGSAKAVYDFFRGSPP